MQLFNVDGTVRPNCSMCCFDISEPPQDCKGLPASSTLLPDMSLLTGKGFSLSSSPSAGPAALHWVLKLMGIISLPAHYILPLEPGSISLFVIVVVVVVWVCFLL